MSFTALHPEVGRIDASLTDLGLAFRHPEAAADPPVVGGSQGAAGCVGASARRRPGKRHGTGKYSAADDNCRNRHGAAMLPTGHRHAAAHPAGRNPGDVWTLPEPPADSAVPIEVPLRCIAAGCHPGGTVLDTFAGNAVTGLAARQLGRPFVGIVSNISACERIKANHWPISRPQNADQRICSRARAAQFG